MPRGRRSCVLTLRARDGRDDGGGQLESRRQRGLRQIPVWVLPRCQDGATPVCRPSEQVLGPEGCGLGLAAERSGHADEAALYLKRAQEALSKPGDSVDESRVRTAVERLDRAWD